jgi:hypothetical protein
MYPLLKPASLTGYKQFADFAVRGLHTMKERKITSLIVVDAEQRIERVLHLHDLWTRS